MLSHYFVYLAISNDDDRDFIVGLFVEHRNIMFTKANNILHDRHYAEDAVGDACIAFIDKIETLKNMPGPVKRAYIVATVRNIAINYAKKLTRQRVKAMDNPSGILENISSDEPEADAMIILGEQVERVKNVIERLPTQEREAMQMKYFLDMSDGEIASHLEVKADSVRKYLLRARNHALSMMKNEDI